MPYTRSDGKIVDLHFKSAVEGVIIKWATQITEVLSADSTAALKSNHHLTPWAGIIQTNIIQMNKKLCRKNLSRSIDTHHCGA